MSGKEKLLITGGLGNLGSWLTDYFSEKFDLYVLSKSVKNNLNCNYTLIQCDITDIDELKKKLTLSFDYCIHTASYNEFFHENYAKKALLINALGTRNLIEVLKNSKIKKFIYLSTFHVYGVNSGTVTEDTALTPKNDYASTHLFAEYYLKQFYSTDNFPYIIFRLTNSYGSPKYKDSRKWYLVLNDLVRSAYIDNKIVLKGNGKAKRDFIWMGDVCRVIEKSFDFQTDRLFNLSTNRTHSMMELAERVQRVYTKRYKKDISIEINKEDSTNSLDLQVINLKLKKEIDFELEDKIDEEIESIFNLLEDN